MNLIQRVERAVEHLERVLGLDGASIAPLNVPTKATCVQEDVWVTLAQTAAACGRTNLGGSTRGRFSVARVSLGIPMRKNGVAGTVTLKDAERICEKLGWPKPQWGKAGII